MTRDEIVAHVRTYLNVKWVHQGRTREQGIDCLGVPALTGIHFGVLPVLPVEYGRRPDGTLVDGFKDYLILKRPDQRGDGDILVFAESSHPCHCGISTTYMGQPGVIHSNAFARKVVEQTLESAIPFIGKPVFTFSFHGLEE